MRPIVARIAFAIVLFIAVGFGLSEAQNAGGAGSGPKPVPTSLPYSVPVVFILSLGADVTTNTDVTVALSHKLEHPGTAAGNQTAFVPEGTWSLNDFVDQCGAFPDHVKGAIVVLPASYQSTNDNYLLMIRNQSKIDYNAMIITCTKIADPMPAPKISGGSGSTTNGAPAVEWVSGVAEGNYGHSEIQFLPLAALTSVYLAFAPQRVYQTVSNRVIPTPNPLPAAGFTNSVSTTQSTTLNSSGTATLQNNVVSAAGIAALLFGRGGSTEHFTVHAAEDAAGDFIEHQLAVRCPGWRRPLPPAPAATSPVSPSAADQAIAAYAPIPEPSPAPSPPAFCAW